MVIKPSKLARKSDFDTFRKSTENVLRELIERKWTPLYVRVSQSGKSQFITIKYLKRP